MEAGDPDSTPPRCRKTHGGGAGQAHKPSVSLDLLIKSLLTLGTTKRDLARIISKTGR